MNLADELRGIKPRKTLQGRIVNNDDPVEPIIQPRIAALDKVRRFVDRAEGEFSPMDIALEMGMTRKMAAEYLSRLKRAGKVCKAGYLWVGKRHARMNLWRKV